MINNHEVSSPSFFNILKVARLELYRMKNLEKLKIPKETALKLLTEANHNMHSYSNKARFIKTAQSTGRIYINDLEKDTRYKK